MSARSSASDGYVSDAHDQGYSDDDTGGGPEQDHIYSDGDAENADGQECSNGDLSLRGGDDDGGYSDGYEDGYADGYDDGHAQGYDLGYEDGHEDRPPSRRATMTRTPAATPNLPVTSCATSASHAYKHPPNGTTVSALLARHHGIKPRPHAIKTYALRRRDGSAPPLPANVVRPRPVGATPSQSGSSVYQSTISSAASVASASPPARSAPRTPVATLSVIDERRVGASGRSLPPTYSQAQLRQANPDLLSPPSPSRSSAPWATPSAPSYRTRPASSASSGSVSLQEHHDLLLDFIKLRLKYKKLKRQTRGSSATSVTASVSSSTRTLCGEASGSTPSRTRA
ncbi:hypothetical protein V8E36_003834 [Tilletia maclaganii]